VVDMLERRRPCGDGGRRPAPAPCGQRRCDLGQVGYEPSLMVHRVSSALEPGARVARPAVTGHGSLRPTGWPDCAGVPCGPAVARPGRRRPGCDNPARLTMEALAPRRVGIGFYRQPTGFFHANRRRLRRRDQPAPERVRRRGGAGPNGRSTPQPAGPAGRGHHHGFARQTRRDALQGSDRSRACGAGPRAGPDYKQIRARHLRHRPGHQLDRHDARPAGVHQSARLPAPR